MSLIELASLGAWAQLCMVWLILLRAQKRVAILSPRKCDDDAIRPSVTVIVPACNEAHGITACVQSILRQKHIDLNIVVVDDRSVDTTASVVEANAINEPRLKLVRIHSLPSGWLGKSHALWQASQGLDADWLLFLDADCKLLDDNAVSATVDHAMHIDADLLTLWPKHDAGSWSEALLIPLCAAVMALWFGRSNQNTASAFANGQFLMVRRKAYEKAGGHKRVRASLIEDVPLAQAMRNAGYITRCAGGRDLVSVRMYDSFKGVFYGWSRIYIGALRSSWKIMLSILWVLISSVWPMVAAVYLLVIAMNAKVALPVVFWAMSGLCVIHLVLLMLVSRGFWKMGGCDRRYLWLYPVSVAGVLAILMHAWAGLAIRKRVKWRTTVYRFDQHACISGASDEMECAVATSECSMADLDDDRGDGLCGPASLSNR